jgi:hypothetical protein
MAQPHSGDHFQQASCHAGRIYAVTRVATDSACGSMVLGDYAFSMLRL